MAIQELSSMEPTGSQSICSHLTLPSPPRTPPLFLKHSKSAYTCRIELVVSCSQTAFPRSVPAPHRLGASLDGTFLGRLFLFTQSDVDVLVSSLPFHSWLTHFCFCVGPCLPRLHHGSPSGITLLIC